jgi:hypothetical protein
MSASTPMMTTSNGYPDYPTNTILTGDGVDLFQSDAIVAGSISSENTSGGSLTAPKLTVAKVEIIGSTK